MILKIFGVILFAAGIWALAMAAFYYPFRYIEASDERDFYKREYEKIKTQHSEVVATSAAYAQKLYEAEGENHALRLKIVHMQIDANHINKIMDEILKELGNG